ncbi:NAD(P)-dependent oxidoreductase [Bradyrhizobium sp. U87765 SZCCT0131]|uniref:NAD(P)-dependent oxidoreductase n=1 Tax=unclassified Bradyrhizobium TaxID=2631580 RepID=UPI001BAD3154|nr:MULTISPECIES: NAD(P)-dependent oxidoreductase [unclassified Bradyrhizobium]MBR1221619.1 NAD(P)-dependent oxidoreductase [Bradyrhizobium sp. U87765 SZCCT0131]MBR1264458.1 NAD(P)-dependent oxidoreductase [Bradyrhizobium sp. U87765 SZCCT0134]MBR1304635.1 NAD(P)-dependent oxidoreductase [Bradyrhizobium sp. U87765 SZCCT0110]MBR1322508.1 NAD(P)-dependent oxidoreductase [Bradyrhizobium sp. U87765 SZCCT0109]MBR1346564.1 NAD(P)-dependent oxidoreductase [Bradyrhizobium sp. U87765 SZCCT0048]
MTITTNTSIAWIGVGKMGLPMAARVVAAGHPVTGYDPSRERLTAGQAQGIQPAASATEAATGKQVVFTSLPDDAALRATVLADGGLLQVMAAGAALIETSTVSAEISAEVAAVAAARGIAYLRAPVSGNASIAHTGALTCFVSGPKAAFEAVRPLLAAITRAQTYLGEAEEARFAKLAVNLMIAVSAGMMAESLALARKGGIVWQDILQVLDDSAIASPMVKYKTAPLRTRDFLSTFSCRQMAKDLDLILSAGHSVGVPLQLAAQVRETYGSLVAQGDGETDFIATVRHVERLSGLDEPKL